MPLRVRERVTETFESVQHEISDALVHVSGKSFLEDKWNYDLGKGGGTTHVFEGEVIERGGINFSRVEGELPESIANRIDLGNSRRFFATGVSVVLHPKNPFVPTVHMNVRYLERGEKKWFGGGIDLTPYYPFEEDIIYFHQTLKITCDKHDPTYYSKFKKWCDEYFFIKHRNEPRGIGGIFFDYLCEDLEKEFSFTTDVGRAFIKTYLPILEKRMNTSYSNHHRQFQFFRRGRYVEFNLVYDRGTLFGLETGGRIESILLSLPPLTAWKYNWAPEPGSPEARLYEVLTPREWVELGGSTQS